MKKIIFCIALFVLISGIGVSALEVDDISYYEKFKGQNISLNVYNWGEYISDGADDTIDVIKEFEKISGIDVLYTNFASNEDLYAKLSSSTAQYDIIIPSDYMIARMIREDMLEKLDYSNIPNIKYISDEYRYTSFDPNAEYAVPYTWGTVGIIYNTKYVDEEVDSWDILWSEKYDGKILMFSNSRDAFGIALKKLGYSMNTTSEKELMEAAALLTYQKPYLQAYVMDQVFDKLELEEAYIAPYYAGDALTMMETNENLTFVHPKEGTNIFIDSICIPKGTKNKSAAEAFINFLCETEIAVANCEYICYSTPHTEALNYLDEETVNDPISYPSSELISKMESYTDLPDETNSLMASLWIQVRSGIGEENLATSSVLPVALLFAAALTILIILNIFRRYKKKNNNY